MIGELVNDRCYFCNGRMEEKSATIPFVKNDNVIVIKNVPAHVCTQCGEATMASPIARNVDTLLKQAFRLHSEISVIVYTDPLTQAA